MKFLQQVNFRFEITTCMILKDNFYNASDFELKVLPGVRFWMRFFTMIQKVKKTLLKAFTISTLDCFYCVKLTDFELFRLFQKAWLCIKTITPQILIKKSTTSEILNANLYNTANFDRNNLPRVRFSIGKFSTRRILKKKFHKHSIFEENFAFKKSSLNCLTT